MLGLVKRTIKHRNTFDHFYTYGNPSGKLPISVKLSRGYGYYAVQGHSRSPILVAIESSYMRLPISD